jgi:hypothetical protein
MKTSVLKPCSILLRSPRMKPRRNFSESLNAVILTEVCGV